MYKNYHTTFHKRPTNLFLSGSGGFGQQGGGFGAQQGGGFGAQQGYQQQQVQQMLADQQFRQQQQQEQLRQQQEQLRQQQRIMQQQQQPLTLPLQHEQVAQVVQKTQETTKPPQNIAPLVTPLCLLKKGTTKGDTITNVESYTCPENSTAFCPGGFTLKTDNGLYIGCEWVDQTTQQPVAPAPGIVAPLPNCKPNEARTIYTNSCLPGEITEQICGEGDCVRQNGPISDCFCPDKNNISEVICRLLDDNQGSQHSGVMNCKEYGTGYEVGCPDGYELNDTADLCKLIVG